MKSARQLTCEGPQMWAVCRFFASYLAFSSSCSCCILCSFLWCMALKFALSFSRICASRSALPSASRTLWSKRAASSSQLGAGSGVATFLLLPGPGVGAGLTAGFSDGQPEGGGSTFDITECCDLTMTCVDRCCSAC